MARKVVRQIYLEPEQDKYIKENYRNFSEKVREWIRKDQEEKEGKKCMEM